MQGVYPRWTVRKANCCLGSATGPGAASTHACAGATADRDVCNNLKIAPKSHAGTTVTSTRLYFRVDKPAGQGPSATRAVHDSAAEIIVTPTHCRMLRWPVKRMTFCQSLNALTRCTSTEALPGYSVRWATPRPQSALLCCPRVSRGLRRRAFLPRRRGPMCRPNHYRYSWTSVLINIVRAGTARAEPDSKALFSTTTSPVLSLWKGY